MTATLNGLVARENDSTNCFTHGEWLMFTGLVHETGALIWGRRTHEIVRGYGEAVLNGFDGLTRIVVSHNQNFALEPGWQLATSPQQAFSLLATSGQTQAVLGGGASLNTAFAQEKLINEVVVFMDSVIVGRGVPMFAPAVFDLHLHLLELNKVHEEVVKLRYQVSAE
jgi:dihydrofolate reductase